MDLFFADDSSQKGFRRGQGRLVAFGGIFVEDGQLQALSDAVDQEARRFGVPPTEELKWSPDRRSWIHTNLVDPDRATCYSRILQVAHGLGVRALIAVGDVNRSRETPEAAFRRCVTYVWERIEMHLGRPARSGLIIADRPGGGAKNDDALLADFLAMTSVGTGWVMPGNVKLNILTTPSHLLRHLQVADIVTGATTAAVAGSRYAAGVFPAVKPLLIKNALGYAGGTGLKLWPDGCLNLYYHVLGESTYAIARTMSGWSLPLERHWRPPRDYLDYFADDGLGSA